MSRKRYPTIGVCLRCHAEYFDMRSWYSRCSIDDCGGYITAMTRDELKDHRAKVQRDDQARSGSESGSGSGSESGGT